MTKKPMLIALSVMSCAAVAGVAFLASAGAGKSLFALYRNVTPGEYSLTIDSDHQPAAIPKRDSAFTVTNARGTTFTLLKTPNTRLNYSEGVVLRVSTVPSAPSVLLRNGDNDLNPEEYYQMHGLKTFSMTFTGTAPYITYGFMHDNKAYFTYQQTLTSGATIDFGDLLPSVFCVISEGTTAVSSVNITYTCSQSDTCKNAWLNSYFASAPKNIVRDGEDNIVSFESGAYPQSRASIFNETWESDAQKAYDRSAEAYLESWYQNSEITPIYGDYYISRFDGQGYVGDIDDLTPASIKLYHRQTVTGSGFDSEFTAGSNYWFAVEPLKWGVLGHSGNDYEVCTEKVIRGGLQYHNNNGVTGVSYNNSTLKTYVDGLFDDFFADSGSAIKANASFNDSKLYLLSLNGYGDAPSARIAEPSVFSRSFGSRNTSVGTVYGLYWTNRIGYNYTDNKAQYVNVDGNGVAQVQTSTSGIRPAMTITIE